MKKISEKLISWASVIEDNTLECNRALKDHLDHKWEFDYYNDRTERNHEKCACGRHREVYRNE